MEILLIALVVVAVLLVVVVALYNGLVRGKNAADDAWSGVNVQLKRRHDLLPNLVAIVRQYAAHERSLFDEVSEARSRSLAAGSVSDQAKAENALSGSLRSLLAISEAYPELKANTNFLKLQEELATLEDEMQMARRYYNGTAREQNDRVRQFPGNLLASTFGFGAIAYFELDSPDERNVPSVANLMN
jgi:LemA protein